MTRSISTLVVAVLFAAIPAAAQQRPSVSSLDAAQKRMNAAICAKADADGDSYRPFSCDPRCDCLAPLLLPYVAASCQETAPGNFSIAFNTPPGTCDASYCSTSSLQLCSAGALCMVTGETCVFGLFGVGSCRKPCGSSADCPPRFAGGGALSGVSPADSPNVVQCQAGAQLPVPINSNDALECLARVEATTPCD
jgi:hypothetical protein